MELNFVLDSSTASAPAGFVNALNYVATVFDQLITNPITVTIDVGYGEIDGQTIEAGAVGESLTSTQTITYAQALAALTANATSSTDASAVASLPSQNPFGSDQIVVATAQEKALGLAPANGTAVDGYIGFDSTVPFEFNLNTLGMGQGGNSLPSSYFDFFAVAEHEVSEVLGRISALDSPGQVSILDLFRYASNGVRSTAVQPAGYFSVNGGVTNLDTYNPDPTQGDLGDWIWSPLNPLTQGDAFNEGIAPGTVPEITSVDTEVMDAIGYSVPASIRPASTTFNLVQSSPTTLTLSGTVSGGVGLYSVELALIGSPYEHIGYATVNQTTGVWSLTIPDGTYIPNGSYPSQSFAVIATDLIGDGSDFNLPSGLAAELAGGSSGTFIFGGGQDYEVSMSAGNATVTDTTAANVQTLTAVQTLEFTGGGSTISFRDSSGDAVTLSNTDNGPDTVTGSGGTVTLINAQVSIEGSDTIIGSGGTNAVIFSSKRDDYAISYSGPGDLNTIVTDLGTGVVDTLTNVQTLQFAAPDNFAGGGASDILGWNPSTGVIGDFVMTDGVAAPFENIAYTSPSSGYQVVGSGDFYGSGTSDILLANRLGQIGEFQMNNNNASWQGLGLINSGAGWAVAGTGDFYGAGTDDILLSNQSAGQIGEFKMTNGVASWQGIGTVGSGWAVAGTGDFYGNGVDDILLANQSAGQIGMFEMNKGVATWQGIGTVNATAGWAVAGTGDFFGNGTDDVLLANSSTGALGMFVMHDGAAAWQSIGAVGAGWQVAGAGDYFGNGTSDILLQNASTGGIGMFAMNNGVASWQGIASLPTGWKVS